MSETPSHCANCVVGYTDSGTPTGSDIMLGGTINCYRAQSPIPTNKAVMLITDVFGHTLVNVRLMADKIAASGITVYVPDLQAGDCLTPETWSPTLLGIPDANLCTRAWMGTKFFASIPSLIIWLGRHGEKETLPIIDRALDAIKELGANKIGVQGFCWGGKYSVLLGATDKVSCIIAAHPSGLTMPKHVIDIKQPALFLCAENDFVFSNANVAETKRILLEKDPENSNVKLYQGVKHGFTVRGDEKDPDVCAKRNDALDLSIAFFLKHLS